MNADKSSLPCVASLETRGEPAGFYGEVNICKTKTEGPTGNWPRSFVGIRLPESLLAEIATWSERNDAASRSEAIRRPVEIGLRFNGEKLVASRGARAKELAGAQIDKMSDAFATGEDAAEASARRTSHATSAGTPRRERREA
jgi:Arc/MetJ-type ribon-helix-helix transcriptional regulator